jgi:hypothetical protein
MLYKIFYKIMLSPYNDGITLSYKKVEELSYFPLGVSHVSHLNYMFTIEKSIYNVEENYIYILANASLTVNGYAESDKIKENLRKIGWK